MSGPIEDGAQLVRGAIRPARHVGNGAGWHAVSRVHNHCRQPKNERGKKDILTMIMHACRRVTVCGITRVSRAAGTRGFPQPRASRAPTILAAAILVVLAACDGPNSGGDTVRVHLAACDAYAATLHSLAAWRAVGELSARDIETVEALRPRLNAICDGETASSDTILVEFNTALTSLILIQSRGRNE